MLEKCRIDDKHWAQKVMVTLQVDKTENGGEPGLIKITNIKSKEVVVEMPTSRTTEVKFNKDWR